MASMKRLHSLRHDSIVESDTVQAWPGHPQILRSNYIFSEKEKRGLTSSLQDIDPNYSQKHRNKGIMFGLYFRRFLILWIRCSKGVSHLFFFFFGTSGKLITTAIEKGQPLEVSHLYPGSTDWCESSTQEVKRC